MNRCPWCGTDELYVKYHDEEWGVPVHDDKKHFEFLVLESAQAGLSWLTVLRKRENYRKAYDDFDSDYLLTLRISHFYPYNLLLILEYNYKKRPADYYNHLILKVLIWIHFYKHIHYSTTNHTLIFCHFSSHINFHSSKAAFFY